VGYLCKTSYGKGGPPRTGAAAGRAGSEPDRGAGTQVATRRGMSWLGARAVARITSGSKPVARAASAASR